ncbi:hypothetical protein F5B22DRAFT_582505 [Xylaria bambusicola]|uniref:uncharacterized protein n=1 Tax=Xylaria bambusicola TaxID=326684 RepID=UPI0020081EEB|nr:uncharacterized protein F5B22DRAFT_582505 [Xylaria bambusicola]KAI0527826.1 hypothetical protein F5B22DRAFT_582505 [Xylaria bambusicola]
MNMIILAFLAAACLVLSQDNRPPDPNNHFIYPPLPGPQFSNDNTVFSSNIAFIVGQPQSQPWKWVSNMSSMMIILQQEGNPESVQQYQLTDCQPGDNDFIYWDGNIGDIDLKNGTQAFLEAFNCSDPGSTPVFFSHYINLTDHSASESTSITTSSTLTRTVSSIQSMVISTSAPAVASPTLTSLSSPSTPPSTSSSSNAAAIGGGIGGGIGGAIVIAAIIFALIKMQKGKSQTDQTQRVIVPTRWAPHSEYYKPNYPSSGQTMSYTPPLLNSDIGSTYEPERAHSTGYVTGVSELPSDTARGS